MTVKKKSPAKKGSKIESTKGKTFNAPKGYKVMDTGFSSAPTHDFEAEATIEGKIIQINDVEKNVKKGIQNDTRVMVIQRTDGKKESVWQSASLAKVFEDVKPGQSIIIKFTGVTKFKVGKKQRSMKNYEVYVK